MAREDWRDRDDMRRRERTRADFGLADYVDDDVYVTDRRAGYRAEKDYRGSLDDYGQAGCAADPAYDPDERRACRRRADADRDYERHMDEGDYRGEPRSWLDRAE